MFHFSKNYFAILLVLLLSPMAVGEEPNEVIVVSQGFGASMEEAKKDALMNAVYQAVGSYIESETLVENDQLIREKILQGSGSYVESHEVIGEPRQREDKLWVMTIRAVVRGGQVKERLTTLDIGSNTLDYSNCLASEGNGIL